MDKPTIEYTSNDFDDVLDNNLSAVVNTWTDHEFGDNDDEDIYEAEVLDMTMMIGMEKPWEDNAAAKL